MWQKMLGCIFLHIFRGGGFISPQKEEDELRAFLLFGEGVKIASKRVQRYLRRFCSQYSFFHLPTQKFPQIFLNFPQVNIHPTGLCLSDGSFSEMFAFATPERLVGSLLNPRSRYLMLFLFLSRLSTCWCSVLFTYPVIRTLEIKYIRKWIGFTNHLMTHGMGEKYIFYVALYISPGCPQVNPSLQCWFVLTNISKDDERLAW